MLPQVLEGNVKVPSVKSHIFQVYTRLRYANYKVKDKVWLIRPVLISSFCSMK